MRPGKVHIMLIAMGIALVALNTSLANPQPRLWTAPDSAEVVRVVDFLQMAN